MKWAEASWKSQIDTFTMTMTEPINRDVNRSKLGGASRTGSVPWTSKRKHKLEDDNLELIGCSGVFQKFPQPVWLWVLVLYVGTYSTFIWILVIGICAYIHILCVLLVPYIFSVFLANYSCQIHQLPHNHDSMFSWAIKMSQVCFHSLGIWRERTKQ